MCGIVGYCGNKQAAPILLEGLSKLEYRGYDSAGIAVRNGEDKVRIVKAKGRLQELARLNGGENITETTLLSAEEQLRYAENYKARLKGANRNGSI